MLRYGQHDMAVREAAIRHCRLLASAWGDAIPAGELTRGFMMGDQHVEILAWGRGIFKPKVLTDGPLTLVSSLADTYDDEHLEHDVMAYDYAPAGSNDWANEGIKRIAALGRPLILIRQVKRKPGPEYMVMAPVFVIDFDDHLRKFRVSLAAAAADSTGIAAPPPSIFAKAYTTSLVQARLHQAHFRRDVLHAYRDRCCVCELGERPLLDAAHIVPDRLPDGLATVTNGMAMCPTHHRAFDQHIVTVTDDYRVVVNRSRLAHAESEPTARALLDYHDRELALPRDPQRRPSTEFLAWHREQAA